MNVLELKLRCSMTAQDAVMQLHDLARWIETNIGTGQLSADVRSCADRLHLVTQPVEVPREKL
jgi:hypothetical protein